MSHEDEPEVVGQKSSLKVPAVEVDECTDDEEQ